MAFAYLSTITLEEAVGRLRQALDHCGGEPRKEEVPVTESLGRVTAEPLYARISAPHYHACAMDGIALQASVTFGATSTTPVTVQPDEYVVVDTGDPLPNGCDAVVMIEDVVFPEGFDANDLGGCPITLYAASAPWGNVRQIGEDICAGEMLLTSGVEITPAAMGAMLAAGIAEVPVAARPRIGIIPTGDEVVPPCSDPKPGDVMEFNSTIFSGMVRSWGGEPVTYPITPDDPEAVRCALLKAVAECDAVLLNAGSSAGRDDYSAHVVAEAGELLFHGVAIKPGKPAMAGMVDGVPVIGVPGYPVSGIVVVESLLKPVIECLLGAGLDGGASVEAVLARPCTSSLKHHEYVRVRLGAVEGKFVATPLSRGAGVVTSFVKADGIMEIPQNSEGFEAGERARVRLLRPLAHIERSLVVIGSHDPLVDEVAQIMHAKWPQLSVASTHVGSMGAIVAAKRHENHCGGIHLLDEATGEYNTSYLERHFPQGGVRQVECVYRQQGLMVAPGNPLEIASLADMAREGMRYVNRQKGSGTRILSDYLCKREGVDPALIYGYDHEEFTHTAVAALVESGSADAGMGIYSAAKIYGLGFVPVCEEQYDLLIPDYAWDTPMVRALLEVLQSPEFRARIEAMGGYRVENPGTVRRHYEARRQI
jgi:putative molybdopterin biosynthesis protein